MAELIIDNHIIDTPVIDIVTQLKKELTNGKLKEFRLKGDHVTVTCPHHADGMEKHPSCGIYCGSDTSIEYGYFHCFTCGESGPLWHFIAECFDQSDAFGKRWLLDRFGSTLIEREEVLPMISLDKEKETFLDEHILDEFQSWHPYLETRKISRKVCEEFKIKYDPKTQCIVFPVWDEHNRLYMLTRRSVNTKKFIIDANKEKPVYLLNYIIKKGIQEITVCESQFNALTCWSWGIPAVALFGTGTKNQVESINKSGVRRIHLCLDGDDAGDHGILRFLQNIRPDIMVDIVVMTRGKDVNDLTENEFDKLPIIDSYDWRPPK